MQIKRACVIYFSATLFCILLIKRAEATGQEISEDAPSMGGGGPNPYPYSMGNSNILSS